MRIIAGIYGGRIFEAPRGHKTHPMSEKMRGAIFNKLGDLGGLTVLDAYSGSGAIALEAKSRGAKEVVAIESDIKAHRTITNNIKALNAEIKVTQANISSWIGNNKNKSFNVIIADPPYENINLNHLNKLSELLELNGILVLSLPPETKVKNIDNCEFIDIKNYGDSSLVFFKKIS